MKMLMAVALMLAFGTTAGAGPFGVSMGDPIKKPHEGWSSGGLGTELREYKGTLGFQAIGVHGTRDGGACRVVALMTDAPQRDAKESYRNLKERLSKKYGEPSSEEQDVTWWGLSGNPDKIVEIVLAIRHGTPSLKILDPRSVGLRYTFENVNQCEKVKDSEL